MTYVRAACAATWMGVVASLMATAGCSSDLSGSQTDVTTLEQALADDDEGVSGWDGQVVVDWDAYCIKAVADHAATIGIPLRTRHCAMMHIAMFDAVNSFKKKYEPYIAYFPVKDGASKHAAALSAAYNFLLSTFPDEQAYLDPLYQAGLAKLSGKPKKIDAGVALGKAASDAIIANRADDNYFASLPWGPANPYWTPATGPGVWVKTLPLFLPFTTPHLGLARPFSVPSGSTFRAPPPYALNSPEYVADYAEVKEVGSKTSATRTADQTQAGIFWQELGNALLNVATSQVAVKTQKSLLKTARDFALVNIAMADAGITCFDSKAFYATSVGYTTWRPITFIRAADDTNPDTVQDPTWLPLISTPPHPDYPSGHACASGAGATTLATLFPNGTMGGIDLKSSFVPGAVRHFDTFEAIAAEVDMARIWGGIHTRHADEQGHVIGQNVAGYVLANSLKKVDHGHHHGDNEDCDD